MSGFVDLIRLSDRVCWLHGRVKGHAGSPGMDVGRGPHKREISAVVRTTRVATIGRVNSCGSPALWRCGMKNEIVVGLDDSPSGKAALKWAAEHAKSIGAALRAVHALDWPYGLSAAGFPAR